MGEATENFLAVVALSILIIIYSYLLISSTQTPSIPFQHRYFAIPRFLSTISPLIGISDLSSPPSTFSDTFENFQTILAEHSTNFYYNGKDYNYSSGIDGQDDFFLSENDLLAKQNNIETSYETIIPSDRYVCTRSWVSIRSEACMTPSSRCSLRMLL